MEANDEKCGIHPWHCKKRRGWRQMTVVDLQHPSSRAGSHLAVLLVGQDRRVTTGVELGEQFPNLKLAAVVVSMVLQPCGALIHEEHSIPVKSEEKKMREMRRDRKSVV